MTVILNGKQLRLKESKIIGKGGEAIVYDIGNDIAVKIFKTPDDIDYQGLPDEQIGAKNRIEEHQKKLPSFPKGLPLEVISPNELVFNKEDKIIGYTMPFLRGSEVLYKYSDKNFRSTIQNDDIVEIFKNLFVIVKELHTKGVVIGDFNDLNILVKDKKCFLIDADSFQFLNFLCKVFTIKFVDPILCDNKLTSPLLIKPHTKDSDWYAFSILLMQTLLFVGPYGGVYKPKDKTKLIPQDARPLRRISVFNDEVIYPKPATHYKILPDDLMHFFLETYHKDKRGVFPISVLENLRFTKCTTCGFVHCRNSCPECKAVSPKIVKETITIRGNVKATRIFASDGVILYATTQNGELKYIYYENETLKREDGTVVFKGKLNPSNKYRIFGDTTYIGSNYLVTGYKNGVPEIKLAVDQIENYTLFDVNDKTLFRSYNGQLLKEEKLGSEFVGEVLQDQSFFWVGVKFGFGFYRAGSMSVYFVFDANFRGINDTVKLAPIKGKLLNSTCYFTDNLCWFIVIFVESGRIYKKCSVIDSKGSLIAEFITDDENIDWLYNIRGKFASGNMLFCPTDNGIVRLEVANGTITKTREFPDTESFVNSYSNLFAGKGGIYSVNNNEIYLLQM